MRTFGRLRRLLATHKELAQKLAAMERKYDGQFMVLPDGDARVDLGRGDMRVTEAHLDEADVGTVVQHRGGGGVAQGVAGTAAEAHGLGDVGADEAGQAARVEGGAVAGDEERRLCTAARPGAVCSLTAR